MNNGNKPKKSNKRRKIVARICGNFGTSFFTPLVSSNVAESVFNVGLDFYETIIVAGLAAIFTTGLIMSREVREFGESV